MMWYTPLVIIGFITFLVFIVWLKEKLFLLFGIPILFLLSKMKVSNIRLINTIFLSVGVTLLFVALGVMTDMHGASVPSWFLVIVPCTLMSISFFTKNEEDVALLPFAAAGALFSFGRWMTFGVGFLVFLFALHRYHQISESSKIPDRHNRPVWIYWYISAVICLLAPPGITYLSFALFSAFPIEVVPAICGLIIFWTGLAIAFHLSEIRDKNA